MWELSRTNPNLVCSCNPSRMFYRGRLGMISLAFRHIPQSGRGGVLSLAYRYIPSLGLSTVICLEIYPQFFFGGGVLSFAYRYVPKLGGKMPSRSHTRVLPSLFHGARTKHSVVMVLDSTLLGQAQVIQKLQFKEDACCLGCNWLYTTLHCVRQSAHTTGSRKMEVVLC